MNRSRAASRKNWALLTNHGAVLMHLARHPNDRVLAIASAVGRRERTASKMIRDLREGGFITIERHGRQNVYAIDYDLPLRRPGLAHMTLRQFLADVATLSEAIEGRADSPQRQRGHGAPAAHKQPAASA